MSQNIVKKIFDRDETTAGEKLSGLFTYFKGRDKKTAGISEVKGSSGVIQAVEFGTGSVKVVSIQRKPDGGIVFQDAVEQMYEPVSDDAKSQRVPDALRKLMGRIVRQGRFVFSTACKDTVFLNMVFPKMSDQELRNAVSWKIRQAKPFNLELEQLRWNYLVWQIIRDGSGEITSQKILAYAVPEKVVIERLAWFKEYGVSPAAAEPAPLGLPLFRKVVPSLEVKADEIAIWIDIGAEESFLVIEKAGIPCYVRGLTLTGSTMIHRIEQTCQVDRVQAEELIKKFGIANLGNGDAASSSDEVSQKVRQALASLLENLIIDIEHTFKHFSYQIAQSSLGVYSRIFLTGGAAQLNGLDLYLSERLGVPVERMNGLTALTASPGAGTGRKQMDASPLIFQNALTLALSGAFENFGSRNIAAPADVQLTGSILAKLQKNPKIPIVILFSLIVFSMVPQWIQLSMTKFRAEKAESRLLQAKKDTGKFQYDHVKAGELEKQMGEEKVRLEARLGAFRQSMQGQNRFSDSMIFLSRLLPDEVRIRQIHYDNKELKIYGVSPDTKVIVKFIDQLKDDKKHFLNPVFYHAQQDIAEGHGYDFEINVTVVA